MSCNKCGSRSQGPICRECQRLDRLADAVENETETFACPSCGGETSIRSVRCHDCLQSEEEIVTDGGVKTRRESREKNAQSKKRTRSSGGTVRIGPSRGGYSFEYVRTMQPDPEPSHKGYLSELDKERIRDFADSDRPTANILFGVSRAECEEIRRQVSNGQRPKGLAEEYPFHASTIQTHSSGNCIHDQDDLDEDPVISGYVDGEICSYIRYSVKVGISPFDLNVNLAGQPLGDWAVSTHAYGNCSHELSDQPTEDPADYHHVVSEDCCFVVNYLDQKGKTRDEIAKFLDYHRRTIDRHLDGDCGHDPVHGQDPQVDGDVLSTVPVKKESKGGVYIEITNAPLISIGVEPGDRVGFDVNGHSLRLLPGDDGLVTNTVTSHHDGFPQLRVYRALNCLDAHPGDMIHIVEDEQGYRLELATKRPNSLRRAALAATEPNCSRTDDDRANALNFPTIVGEYLRVRPDDRISIVEESGDWYIVPYELPDEISYLVSGTKEGVVKVGAKVLKKLGATEGDKVLAIPAGKRVRIQSFSPDESNGGDL